MLKTLSVYLLLLLTYGYGRGGHVGNNFKRDLQHSSSTHQSHTQSVVRPACTKFIESDAVNLTGNRIGWLTLWANILVL